MRNIEPYFIPFQSGSTENMFFFDTKAYSEAFITRISSKIAIGKKAFHLPVTLGFLKPHVYAVVSTGIRTHPHFSQPNRTIFLSIHKVVMRSCANGAHFLC